MLYWMDWTLEFDCWSVSLFWGTPDSWRVSSQTCLRSVPLHPSFSSTYWLESYGILIGILPSFLVLLLLVLLLFVLLLFLIPACSSAIIIAHSSLCSLFIAHHHYHYYHHRAHHCDHEEQYQNHELHTQIAVLSVVVVITWEKIPS